MSAPVITGKKIRPLDADKVFINRADEGTVLAGYILSAQNRFVVLHGETDSGKTDLMRRWVVPALEADTRVEGRRVFYGSCGSTFPTELTDGPVTERFDAVIQTDCIVILDDFERLLVLPRDDQQARLEELFELLGARGPRTIVVVLADSRYLNGVYELSLYDIDATDSIRQLKTLAADEVLTRINSVNASERVQFEPELLQEIRRDCDALNTRRWSETFELARLIHTSALALCGGRGDCVITSADYNSLGGAKGILRAHLERQLGSLSVTENADSDIAHAILEHIVESRRRETLTDFPKLGTRFGVDSESIERVALHMQQRGLLERKSDGGWRVMPPQLLNVVEDELATHVAEIEGAATTVADGTRSWQRQGTLLSPFLLKEVHEERRHLNLNSDELRFMLHSAVVNGPDDVAAYWLKRITECEDGVNVLLRTLVHQSSSARQRSALLMQQFDRDDVREALLNVALRDNEADVRAQAISSLKSVQTPELKAEILQQVWAVGGRYRESAIDALRIFPALEITGVLQQLVSNAATPVVLKERAIALLAVLNTPDAVNVLLDIAIDDADAEDRESGARALGGIQSSELIQQIFARLDDLKLTSHWIVLAFLTLGIMLSLAASAVLVPALFFLVPWEVLISALVIIAPASAFIAGNLLDRLRRKRRSITSPLGITAMLFLAVSAVTVLPVVHGLAHFTLRFRKRAAVLFGLEILGLLCIYVIPPVMSVYALLDVVANVYLAIGVVLFAGTYLYDVVGVLSIVSEARVRVRHRNGVYRQLFANSAAATLVFDSLHPPTPPVVNHARRLLRNFGVFVAGPTLVQQLQSSHSVPAEEATRLLSRNKTAETLRSLLELWNEGGALVRQRIVTVLSRNPTEHSLAELRKLGRQLGKGDRWRLFVAPFVHKFSVWPRWSRLAIVAILPVLLVVAYSGVMFVRDPLHWAVLTTLREKDEVISRSRKFELIGAVSRVDREKIAPFLLKIYGKFAAGDSVHAAISMALSDPDLRLFTGDSLAALERLRLAVRTYADSVPNALAVGVLKVTALDADSVVSGESVRGLVQFIQLNTDDIADSSQTSAVSTLAALDYKRAIPLLDSLANVKRGTDPKASRVRDALATELERTSQRAVSQSSSATSNSSRTGVLTVLSAIKHPSKAIAGDIVQLAHLDSLQSSACDLNGDGQCDDVDHALQYIHDNPNAEFGYTDLVGHIVQQHSYKAAADALQQLVNDQPELVWPRKTLSAVFHEDLSLQDTAYFYRSYDELRKLRLLDSYRELRRTTPADYERIEYDYIEAALSARKYLEVDSLTRRLPNTPSASQRFNAALFAYVGFVMANNRATAVIRLGSLETAINTLPADFSNDWNYPGTNEFIRKSGLSADAKQALLALCRAGKWYSAKEAADVMAKNRAVLQVMHR